jgi:hypothetical protein
MESKSLRIDEFLSYQGYDESDRSIILGMLGRIVLQGSDKDKWEMLFTCSGYAHPLMEMFASFYTKDRIGKFESLWLDEIDENTNIDFCTILSAAANDLVLNERTETSQRLNTPVLFNIKSIPSTWMADDVKSNLLNKKIFNVNFKYSINCILEMTEENQTILINAYNKLFKENYGIDLYSSKKNYDKFRLGNQIF